jgi:thioredoxin 1
MLEPAGMCRVLLLGDMTMVQKILVLLVALLLAGCSGDQDRDIAHAGPAGHQLIFFIDPGGRPCQMQDHILQSLAGDLHGRVDLRYVLTTVAEDRRIFYKYGIRALPSLVLVDPSGNEVGRLTPGVKSAEDILMLVNTISGG